MPEILSLFEITRRESPREARTLSGILPDATLPVGKPMMISGSNVDTGAKTFAVAETRCDGFLTRAVRTAANGVRTDEEIAFGFGLETPFLGGREGSIEPAEELIVEGADYVDQGAGAGQITINVTNGQDGALLSFNNGLFHLAVEGDYAQYRLIRKLTPNDPANVRIQVQRMATAEVVPAP